MSFAHLRSIDLNLLLVFHHLMDTRSVSRAAVSLDMSQPAVSGALARLRESTGDALFVRAGRQGMQPTAYAQEMAEPVAVALQHISQGLRPPAVFDAATSERSFTMAMLDAAEAHFMPRLVAHCAVHAPGVRLVVRPFATEEGSARSALLHGGVDLVVGAFEEMPQGARQQLLFEQRFVLIGRGRGAPASAVNADAAACSSAAPGTPLPVLSRRVLARSRLVVQQHPQGAYAAAQQAILSVQKPGVVNPVCASLLAMPLVVGQSDVLALVPLRLAQSLAAAHGLWVGTPDVALPMLKTYCFWHPRDQRDPGSQWLRQLLLCLFGDHPITG